MSAMSIGVIPDPTCAYGGPMGVHCHHWWAGHPDGCCHCYEPDLVNDELRQMVLDTWAHNVIRHTLPSYKAAG